MNFLAHLHLAEPSEASLVGNFLGDFVRGRPEFLLKTHPPEIVRGIRMHRALDRFTDSHPAFLEAKSFLNPTRRRLAGIVVDIIFDYFLSLHWKTFSTEPRLEFIARAYRTLESHPEWLPADVLVILPRLKQENWLNEYSTFPGLDRTFRRVATRRQFLAPVADTLEDLQRNLLAFEACFHSFYPAAVAAARAFATSTSTVSPPRPF